MRKRASRPPQQVFTVTGLPASLKDDRDERLRRYLLSMGIRTVCFILAVVALAVLHWTVLGWALVIAAVVLPYIAVVMANATRSPGSTTLGPVAPDKTPVPDETPVAPDEATDKTTDKGAAPQPSPRRPDEEPPR